MDKYIEINGIRLHYLEFAGEGPTILLSHGLTANAHAFDGLIQAGLSPKFRVISVDLRGRGLSSQPEDYSMMAHTQDIIGLLDNLHIEKAIMGGHSFGAFITMHLAYHYPERAQKLLLMDAAAQMHPNTREMLQPTLSRLGKKIASFETYIEQVKQMPFLQDAWEDHMLSYYRADVEELEDGSVLPRSKPEHIAKATDAVLGEPWADYIAGVSQPALLINATGSYGDSDAPPLLPKENALETVDMMQNCQYQEVAGNHQTMLYGEGAQQIVRAIENFLRADK